MFMLAAILVAPNFGNAFHGCDGSQVAPSGVSVYELESNHAIFAKSKTSHQEKKPSLPHGEDCNCPLHRSGCHHGTAYLHLEHGAVLPIQLVTNKFSEGNTPVKPGPFLEGPFQPPRT